MLRKRTSRFLSLILVLALSFTTVFSSYAALETSGNDNVETRTATGTSDDANAYAIYPIPQSITYDENHTTFTLNNVAIVAEAGIDIYTKAYLKEVLDEYGVTYTESNSIQSGKTNILLGVNGSNGVVDAYVNSNIEIADVNLYSKNDAHMLDVKEGYIVIEGKDTDSVFHGVSTLKMMFSSFAGTKFLTAHVEDYATVETRGYIEGFYGAWDWQSRADLMKFARDYKMNSYVYAAKNDSYHTSQWNVLYPKTWLDEFAKIVELGKQTKVEFGWSIHMGSFFNGLSLSNTSLYESRYSQLMAKFDQLYQIGVRDFDILNDDFGNGSYSDVVTVLNRINADLKTKYASDPCDNISYCPQGYNKAWSGTGAELAALQNLDDDIYLYWTGDDVNAPITQDTVNYVTQRSGHAPDYWLNYPVNEHASAGIFLGDITYYARDNVTGLAGFHSNPCRYPYASEVGLYQLAALVWNNNNYSEHAQDVWKSAFDYLQPEVKDSYFKIANHIANAPNSSRVPGFNESEYIAEKLQAVIELLEAGQDIKASAEAQAVLQEFVDIIDAIEDFRENCANKGLVAELDPWLNSLDDLAHAGQAALESIIALEDDDASASWENLSSASKYYDTVYTYTNPANNTAKAGSKRLYPFVTKIINVARNNLNPVLNPSDTTVNPSFIGVLGGAERAADANALKMYDGDITSYAGWQVVQKAGDYFGLDLGRVINVTDITILQGQEDGHHDIFHNASLQYSEDKVNWTNITDAVVSEDGCLITAEGLNIQARYVRYYLNATGFGSKPDYWTFVREFTVNKTVEEEHDRVYTNVDTLKQTPLTIEGSEISVRELRRLTLNAGQYVGIRFVNPETAIQFVKELQAVDGIAFEYSFNGTEWKNADEEGNTVGVKYLRLINKSTSSVTFDMEKIGVEIQNLKAEPSLLTSTVGNGLSAGSYDNVFDGDLTTYALTGGNPVNGNYITFDLGKTIDVYDVTLATTDGNQHLYNAKIQISKDNSTWTDIAVVTGNESFTPPYRYINADGNGAQAKYLRIYFTGNSSYQLQLHEIQINKEVDAATASAQIVSNMSGNLAAVIDKDISTLFVANAKVGDYIEYRITDNTNVDQISVLQGEAGNGKVYAVTPSGNRELGILNQTVSVFDTTEIDTITAVRIEWNVAEEVVIHELGIGVGASSSDDIGEYVEPIILGEEVVPVVRNLAPGKVVTVSGTSDGNKDYVNDMDTSTKWDSNNIKSGQGANASDIGDSWIYIDLGAEDEYEISQIVVRFFNKIYPTSWVIQTSDDATNWDDVTDVMTKANDGPTHPVETIDFETPVTGRYVRLYFNTLNTVAAGNGIGVSEFEIYGKEIVEQPPVVTPVDKAALAAAIAEAEALSAGDYTADSWETFATALAAAKSVNANANATQAAVNTALANLTAAQDALEARPVDPQPPVEPVNPFEDVYDTDYYYDPVMWAVEEGITDGWTPTLFAPEMGCTRGQVVTFLWRAAGEPEAENAENPFTDVPENAYYYDAVLWAVEEGITDGWTATTFAPDMTCTRGQIVTFIWRAAGEPEVTAENPFTDVAENAYYYDAVLWAVKEGITDGWMPTEFAPEMDCTRGQIVTFLYRFYN